MIRMDSRIKKCRLRTLAPAHTCPLRRDLTTVANDQCLVSFWPEVPSDGEYILSIFINTIVLVVICCIGANMTGNYYEIMKS